jgi:hypothetical protein
LILGSNWWLQMGRIRQRFVANKSRQGTFYSKVHKGKNVSSCIDKAVHVPGTSRAKSLCAASRNPIAWDGSPRPYYWNQLREMFVNVTGILLNEMHISGILSYETQMHILEMRPRDSSPHVPWIKQCNRSTQVPSMKPREIPACPPDIKLTYGFQKWNRPRYLCMCSRMKPSDISECIPEWNRQRCLRVLQKRNRRT